MSKEFKLPELGENIESADIINVLVKPGDKIEKEQAIIEIETDKATIEVPSSFEGVVKEVLVKIGEKVKVGQVLIMVDEDGDGKTAPEETTSETKEETKSESKEKKEEKPAEEFKPQKTEKPVSKKGSIVEMTLPELGENIESAEITNVLVKEGDIIEKEQGIIEIETDKATVEVPSNVSGKIVEVLVKTGEKANVGQVIIKVESSGTEVKEEAKPVKKEDNAEQKSETKKERELPLEKEKGQAAYTTEPSDQPPITRGSAPAAPSVRRLAREIGINIKDVPGTGPSGRISMSDVKAYAKKLNESRTGFVSGGIKKEELPDFSKFGEVEIKPTSNVRQKTAEHLSYAWATIPHVTQHDKADITELEKLRKELNQKAKDPKDKLTMTSILAKVCASALKVFPQFNSSIDLEKKEIIYKKYYNIGIAVDTEHGLIVPVLKHADRKNLAEITSGINILAEKARNKKVSLDDLQGACFTITNLGGIGGTSFTPIVNSPEVAILGVSKGSYEPVYNGKNFEPCLMLPLSLSYDHRVIDGADAARFLRWVCEVLQNPMKLLKEG
ncbi:MAG: branched-chain alpha-keto acid dehydrogenase subunit E2 [Ignavibacteria bacterium GWA2_35_9]|nr:MAG: branched-chain alpha-keto acid dehydrogenase subunit E2 [Ignavibacteria bacterium GWA2_35_9]